MGLSDQNARYGGFWIRVLAGIFDSIILLIILSILGAIAAHFFPGYAHMMQPPHQMMTGAFPNNVDVYTVSSSAQILNIVVSLLYYALLESSSWQASIGMKICGLKITDDNYQRISFLRALGREIAAYLSAIIIFIGYFMIAFTRRKQGLHDMIASTYVVRN